jgi:hypothetical protein
MRNTILLLSVVLIAFSSCERESSADVNQDRIYTIYSLVYEEGQDITYARAWFRFGSATGTLLELAEPSFVECNDQLLGFKNALAYYEKSFAGQVSQATFHWENIDQVAFENTVSIQAIAFPESLTEINGDEAYSLEWDGPALGSDDYVAVAINGDFEGDATLHTESTSGSTSIVIPKTALDKLPKNQNATFWLEYGINPDLDESTEAGGEIYGKYRVSKEIMIK